MNIKKFIYEHYGKYEKNGKYFCLNKKMWSECLKFDERPIAMVQGSPSSIQKRRWILSLTAIN